MASQGLNETLQLPFGETLAVYSPPGCGGWRIRAYYPSLLTGRGEQFRNGDTSQLGDGLYEVGVRLPVSWFDREFVSPAAAAAFVTNWMASHWPEIVARAQGRRLL
jgi:hypothetical protein